MDEIKVSMEEMYQVMVKMRVIPKKEISTKESEGRDCYCRYHAAYVGHSIQKCEDFRKMLQDMMNRGDIELFGKVIEESINVITNAKFVEGSSSK